MTALDTLRVQMARLPYPCYLVLHGPARHHRTLYRREHGDWFWAGLVDDAVAAEQRLTHNPYEGRLEEMAVIAVTTVAGQVEEHRLQH